MYPPQTTVEGISTLPGFVDVLTGEKFAPWLETQDNRNGSNNWDLTPDGIQENYFHYGSFRIGDDVIYLVVGYYGSLRYPTVLLTWGEGANVLDPGVIIDSFQMVSTEQPPTNTKLSPVVIKGETGATELYLLVDSPVKFGGVSLETSTDLKNWKPFEVQPEFIFGESITYRIPEAKVGFFRGIVR